MGSLISHPPKPLASKHYNGFVKHMPAQTGKFFAITGTTSGIGFEAAKAIVGRGGNALCLNRPSPRATESIAALQDACADGGTAAQVDCDLQDFSSVRTAAEAVQQRVQGVGLHALLNNAGTMGDPEKATKDGYDVQMQTNHLSHFLLASLLMPSLEAAATKTGDARIVNQTGAARFMKDEGVVGEAPLEEMYMRPLSQGKGLGGDGKQAAFKRYQQSKLANVAFTLALKDKLTERGSKVKALVAHPGICETAFRPLYQSTGGKAPSLGGRVMFGIIGNFVQSAGDGSLPLLAAAVNPDAASGDFYGPRDLGLFGRMFKDEMTGPPVKADWHARAEKEAPAVAKDAQEMLWQCSESAAGRPFFSKVPLQQMTE